MSDCPSAAHGTPQDPYGCYERERAEAARIDRIVETVEARVDAAIYSNVSTWRDGRMVRQTWRELAEEREAEIARLRGFERMVLDLDRNENGRHEGDADVGDRDGVSQGNPLPLTTGSTLGYGLGGSIRYVMPERGKRHDPDAWIS